MPLTASQCIKLITQITERLSAEDYSLIDLTLSQFGLRTSERWEGSREEYVIAMLKDAESDALQELGVHVGVATDSVPRIEPSFWQPGMFRVFISHLATHRDSAAKLQVSLRDYGITAFVAHNDIEPTAEWIVQIETALATAEALVALLHPKFHASSWVDQEIGYAMGRGIPTYSIALGEMPYGFIGRFQAFNGRNKSASTVAKELFLAYRRNKQTQRRMAETVVSLFERSDTFDEAKKRMKYIEELEIWDNSFSGRLRAAEKANSQISGSWGVSDRIKEVVKKWKQKAGV